MMGLYGMALLGKFEPVKSFRTPPQPLRDKIAISFSGGKSSAYMTKMLLDHFRANEPERQILVIFANTGQEHPETLRFIEQCDREFGFGTVWIEAVTNPRGVGMGYRVVDFETASRNGEPFERAIEKYGISNKKYPQCTSRLKTEPMEACRRDMGMPPGTYSFAVGIRADEIHRASGKSMEQGCFYPLVDAGVTKDDVREFWTTQPFNLNIPEHLGNCVWCWKKSNRKLLTIARSHPEAFEFPARMERENACCGGPRRDGQERQARTFFRGNRSAQDILALAQQPFEPFVDDKFIPYDEQMDEHGSCGDSCEVGADKNDLYDPEELDLFDERVIARIN
jgi:3'-phosphoadenosine 5'-phosphosulfate sulfotransferase (PAPS reductase)/FAD synthetase